MEQKWSKFSEKFNKTGKIGKNTVKTVFTVFFHRVPDADFRVTDADFQPDFQPDAEPKPMPELKTETEQMLTFFQNRKPFHP